MSLQTFTQNLTANQNIPLSKKGDFLQLLSATGSLTVEINGQTFEMEPGDHAVPDGGFTRIRITDTSAAANEAKFIVGKGDFRRFILSGNVSVTNVVSVDDNGASLTIDDGGVALTPADSGDTSYHRSSSSAALNTIVTPAANTNGIRVTGFHLDVSGSFATRIMHKTSAPSSFWDGMHVGVCIASASADISDVALPLIIPAGHGLYEQAGSAAANSLCNIAYEVL